MSMPTAQREEGSQDNLTRQDRRQPTSSREKDPVQSGVFKGVVGYIWGDYGDTSDGVRAVSWVKRKPAGPLQRDKGPECRGE
ncbi:hypothetical protein ACOMHN_036081 [Nucella lapillus]